MLANLPPLSLFQFQTLGGVYSGESVMALAPGVGRFAGVRMLRRVERRKAPLEIGLQILDILQPDVEPQRRTARRPVGGRAVGRAVEGNGEALKTAPGITHAEQLECIEQGVDGSLRLWLQNDAEQAGGAAEIALPDPMAGMGIA